MKKRLPLLALSLLMFSASISAQLEKTIACTANGLAISAGADIANITNLTLTGIIDQRDFITMRDLMPQLIRIDMSQVSIASYTDTQIYPVNSIPEFAFDASEKPGGQSGDENTTLNTVILPANLTGIDKYAFCGCNKLTNINLPTTLTTIGESAFENCDSFTDITIPSSITTIEDGLFYDCDMLAKVTLPEGITSIGFEAFTNCLTLKDIKLPSTLNTIGIKAFLGCNDLTIIKIPASVTTIADNAFADCTSLIEVINLSETPQVITATTFNGVNLTTCKLFVPTTAIGVYKTTQWNDFQNINIGSPTSVKSEELSSTKIAVNNGTILVNSQNNICCAELVNFQGATIYKTTANSNSLSIPIKSEKTAILKLIFQDGHNEVIKIRN